MQTALATAETIEAPKCRTLVYFIQPEMGGPVKIGAATDPYARLEQLQTGSPFRLSVIATCTGGFETERALHRQFTHLRLYGEWFEDAPELMQFIQGQDDFAIRRAMKPIHYRQFGGECHDRAVYWMTLGNANANECNTRYGTQMVLPFPDLSK